MGFFSTPKPDSADCLSWNLAQEGLGFFPVAKNARLLDDRFISYIKIILLMIIFLTLTCPLNTNGNKGFHLIYLFLMVCLAIWYQVRDTLSGDFLR